VKNTKKFASLAGKLNIGVIVFMGITILGFLLCIIAVVLGIAKPDFLLNDNGLFNGTFSIGDISLVLSNSVIDLVKYQNFFIMGGIFGALSMVLVFYMEKQIYNVLACIKRERPFESLCIKSIKTLGFCIILGSVFFELTKNLSSSFLYKMLELDTAVISSPLINGSIKNYSFLFPLNAKLLGVGIIVLFLSYVFEYGAYLQSEYDETL
jgi:hypothetical protein